MKNYIVKLTIYTGGYEKTAHHYIEAETPEQAGDQAILDESHDPEENSVDYATGQIEDGCGEFIYEIHSITEVTEAEAKILAKYL